MGPTNHKRQLHATVLLQVFEPHTKMFNVIKDKSQPSCNIIKYYNIEKFKYDYYLMIFVLKLLSSIVMVGIWLTKIEKSFGQK